MDASYGVTNVFSDIRVKTCEDLTTPWLHKDENQEGAYGYGECLALYRVLLTLGLCANRASCFAPIC